MNKRINTIKYLTAAFSVLFMLASCQTTKDQGIPSDSYDQTNKIEITEENEISDEIESLSSEDEEKKSTSLPTFKRPKSQSFFTLGNADTFIPLDETATVITREVSGISEKEADVVLRANTNLAGFGTLIYGSYYIIQFDEEARKKLAKASEQYFDDFENKRLNQKKKMVMQAYGKINYMLNWGTFRSSTANNGKGTGFMGYEFVKGQPYFIISNYPFQNDYYEIVGDATTRESTNVKFYFTRKQLKNLVEILSDENLAQYY